MKTCENCYWADKCPDAGKRCEYYDPIIGGENIVRREYEESLKERVEEYNDLVREQQDDYNGD
jgi:hypothetical protein